MDIKSFVGKTLSHAYLEGYVAIEATDDRNCFKLVKGINYKYAGEDKADVDKLLGLIKGVVMRPPYTREFDIELLIEDTSINVLILQQPYSGIIASFLQTNFYQISKSKLTA